MAAGNDIRVSDAEREAAAAELREHFASGRLSQDELDERLTAAFAARTRGDLNALFTDLPSSGRDQAGAGTAGGQAFGPFGSRGAFGANGAFGPGASGESGWQAGGNARLPLAARGIGRLMVAAALFSVMVAVGLFGVFGIGAGTPIGIVLIVAAFALLRRLLLVIFGRRLMRGRGPRRGRGRRCC